MRRQRVGITAGVIFGILDIIPMFLLDEANNLGAISSAFIHRVLTGWIISAVDFPLGGWTGGAVISVLLALPIMIIVPITSALPILLASIIGGGFVGWAVDKWGSEEIQG